jgi:acetolactate synthase-1/2/3 large subunit
MRVCDYIAKKLVDIGIHHIYGLVGGGAAGLNDGFFSNKELEFVCFHHEQGAAHAAVGSARTTRKLSVVNVTTGCGGTNVLTSCLNAWQESVPVLFLSGNTQLRNMAYTINKQKNINLRRYGVQEHNIVQTVSNMTKLAVLIESPKDVAYELERAIDIATSGRPGPVWIDIPSDIQILEMPETPRSYTKESQHNFNYNYSLLVDEFTNAKRPLIIAGAGINIANAGEEFKKLVEKTNSPFVTTFLTKDLIETRHDLNIGMVGIKGNRAANFAMQNCDLLLIIGSSMNVTHIGYDVKTFSPHSKKIMVDIDRNELNKDTFFIDYPILMDSKQFINELFFNINQNNYLDWATKCLHWKNKWPIYNQDIHRSDEGGLNLYEICESMNRNMQPKDTVIVDAGQPCYIWSTNGKYKNGCRYMAQAAQGDMGYAIPAVVGIHKSDPSLNPIIVIGEGSFMTNIQELATIVQHKVPVKIFIINNDGYMSQKQTQNKFFGGRSYGVDNSTGLNFPSIKELVSAFGISYEKISNNSEMDFKMPWLMQCPYPIAVEFMSQHTLDVQPAQAFKPNGVQGGLHDMSPFLSIQELESEMIIKI